MLDELHTISVPELRRRVDHAVAQLREMRHALAVQAGMTLEDAPRPIPAIDPEEGRACLDQMLATLPLLRKPLTPEERARLQSITAGKHERMQELFDHIIANKDEFEQVMARAEQPVSYEKIITLRESFDKMAMIDEFAREVRAYTEELRAFQQRLEERVATTLAGMTKSDEPPS